MSNERVVLCGGIPGHGKRAIRLHLSGGQRNINLKVTDISDKMVANMPPVLVDLLEVAAYVYCADQAATRGGDGARCYGANWRRTLQFHIPVREPQLWSSAPVLAALQDTLGFLSEDQYAFAFEPLTDPPPISQYLEFGPGGATGFDAEEVVLFSGGIDSLAGVVQESVVDGRRIALVSHRSSPKIARRQKELLKDLESHCPTPPFHVPVWVNKDKALGREYSQRTRSFLYAALATVVARIFDLSRIHFYENGVVSINLPISPQALGSRATRTTHPQALNGLARFFSALLEDQFEVENPFIWKTKADVVRVTRAAGCGELLKHTVSCTHVWEMTTLKTHCGVCSQCIDRRFATLAAECSDEEDPEEMYDVDLLLGQREPGESRTTLESYVRTARRIKNMSEQTFFSEFGEVHRVTRDIKGKTIDEAACAILDLHKRHAVQVSDVIARGIQSNAENISDGKVPASCLLILALPEEYKRPPAYLAVPRPPILVLDEIRDGDTNRTLVAEIVGCGRLDGIRKRIGSRELFFIYQLFKSTRFHDVAGERITVITQDDAARELLAWRDAGHLRFSGKDEDKPSYRVQKMWGEFVRQIGKWKRLGELFAGHHVDTNGQKLYALRLHPDEKQILASSVPALLRKRDG